MHFFLSFRRQSDGNSMSHRIRHTSTTTSIQYVFTMWIVMKTKTKQKKKNWEEIRCTQQIVYTTTNSTPSKDHANSIEIAYLCTSRVLRLQRFRFNRNLCIYVTRSRSKVLRIDNDDCDCNCDDGRYSLFTIHVRRVYAVFGCTRGWQQANTKQSLMLPVQCTSVQWTVECICKWFAHTKWKMHVSKLKNLFESIFFTSSGISFVQSQWNIWKRWFHMEISISWQRRWRHSLLNCFL